jgi:hypothetical protein
MKKMTGGMKDILEAKDIVINDSSKGVIVLKTKNKDCIVIDIQPSSQIYEGEFAMSPIEVIDDFLLQLTTTLERILIQANTQSQIGAPLNFSALDNAKLNLDHYV